MQIGKILQAPWVVHRLRAVDKPRALRELAAHLCEHCRELSGRDEEVVAALMSRERLATTGVGDGVAIPHAKVAGLGRLVGALGCLGQGLDFAAVDGQPVRLIFLLLIPQSSGGAHLKALARISRLLRDAALRQALLACGDAPGLWRALVDVDERG